jgi:antirestriction protein
MKTIMDFMQELQEVHNILVQYNGKTDAFYKVVEDLDTCDPDKKKQLFEFCDVAGLPNDSEALMAAATRVVSLRDDSMVVVLKKHGADNERVKQAKARAYEWVADYYNTHQKIFLEELESKKLLTPFYRAVFQGWHEVGLCMSKWQPKWTEAIVEGVNKELSSAYDGDDDKIASYLEDNGLLDKGHDGATGDRSYSVLSGKPGDYKVLAYADRFPEEVASVVEALGNMKNTLSEHEDEVFREKSAWLNYLQALMDAFSEKDRHQLIERWADVDRTWMQISSPVQPGHPLEYYEDHYRKAVALEWDIRLSNPEHATKGVRKRRVSDMSQSFYEEKMQSENPVYRDTVDFALRKLDSVQLHIGRAGVFYGADYCGLFSAQVVPNDEVVSREHGKKIFAFPDNIMDTQKNRPFMRLGREVYGEEFVKEQRRILFQDKPLWFQIYDITTIGHEYGHILWVNNDTEAVMNKTGNYKNVEEWKATVGGLMAFFTQPGEEEKDWKLKKHILTDVITRSVGLIGWRETSEVLPYYLEGLIHLKGLFDCGVLNFDEKAGKLEVVTTEETFNKAAAWYDNTYRELVFDYYLPKNDPTPFLRKYAKKQDGYYIPVDEKIAAFANWYWDMYQKYGREIDKEDCRENYTLN